MRESARKRSTRPTATHAVIAHAVMARAVATAPTATRTIATLVLSLLLALRGPSTAHAADATPPQAGAGFGASPIGGCGTDLVLLNQVTGWQTEWPGEWAGIAAAPGDAVARKAALTRWRAADAVLDADIRALDAGIARGRTAPTAVAQRVLQQARDLHAMLVAGRGDVFVAGDSEFARQWRVVLVGEIAPAIARYTRFLETRYLPAIHEASALAALDDQGACFREATRWWTTLGLDSDAVEAIGERLLADTRAQLAALTDGEPLADTLARLRATAATTYADTDDAALIAVSTAALERARTRLPSAFEKTVAPIVVAPMQAHMQASFPAGFYRPGASIADTAAYVINPSRPAERRLMAETIAFHEGLPGHHLFHAYPRGGHAGEFNSGLAEGWAIYAEQLADEMGLYSTSLDRQGMHAKHLWAASRLVIEPRLHSGRWSRQEAIDYMRATTALPDADIEIEIDRYLAMPGQSLSYMLGFDVLLRARERARARLGDRFDLRSFHSAVLAPGLRPLPEVEADIDRWAEARSGDAPVTPRSDPRRP